MKRYTYPPPCNILKMKKPIDEDWVFQHIEDSTGGKVVCNIFCGPQKTILLRYL